MENFTITSDLIRGHIDTIILKSLFDGDKYAQEIANYIEDKSGKTYEVKQTSVYADRSISSCPYHCDISGGGRPAISKSRRKKQSNTSIIFA